MYETYLLTKIQNISKKTYTNETIKTCHNGDIVMDYFKHKLLQRKYC